MSMTIQLYKVIKHNNYYIAGKCLKLKVATGFCIHIHIQVQSIQGFIALKVHKIYKNKYFKNKQSCCE